MQGSRALIAAGESAHGQKEKEVAPKWSTIEQDGATALGADASASCMPAIPHCTARAHALRTSIAHKCRETTLIKVGTMTI
eukprot:1671705-Rhodomonas_salina.1